MWLLFISLPFWDNKLAVVCACARVLGSGMARGKTKVNNQLGLFCLASKLYIYIYMLLYVWGIYCKENFQCICGMSFGCLSVFHPTQEELSLPCT